jgi:hypothetical protein
MYGLIIARGSILSLQIHTGSDVTLTTNTLQQALDQKGGGVSDWSGPHICFSGSEEVEPYLHEVHTPPRHNAWNWRALRYAALEWVTLNGVLYSAGSSEVMSQCTLGLCGSRRCTEYRGGIIDYDTIHIKCSGHGYRCRFISNVDNHTPIFSPNLDNTPLCNLNWDHNTPVCSLNWDNTQVCSLNWDHNTLKCSLNREHNTPVCSLN